MDITNLRSAYQTKITEAKSLVEKWAGKEADMPKAEAEKVAAMLGQADEIKANIDLMNRLQQGENFAEQPATLPMAWRQAGPAEGQEFFDKQSYRSVKVGLPGWEREFRFYVPERVQKKGYAPAFEAYLRRGKDALGPTDFKTLTEGVDSAGGYLVPADVQTEIIKKLAAGSVMRQLCYSTPTSRDTVRWPRITYTTNDIYTSGVRLTWTGEVPSSATVHRVTDPVFGEINIPVHTAMASMPISNDLIDDAAYDVLGVSSELIAEAFRLGEDNVFLNGTGTGQPMGLLTQVTDTTGTTAPAYAVSGAAGALTTSGDAWSGKRLVDLYYALPAQYRARAAWVMCSSTMGALESLVDANDRPLVEPFAGGSIQTLAEPVKLKNKPVFVDEFVPSLTTNSYSVVLGDFFGYKILDRVGFSVQRLNELYAETNLTLLLAKKRVGGFCAEPYRFKVLKAGTS